MKMCTIIVFSVSLLSKLGFQLSNYIFWTYCYQTIVKRTEIKMFIVYSECVCYIEIIIDNNRSFEPPNLVRVLSYSGFALEC